MHEGNRKAILAAFLANVGIAIAKFVAFAFTGAASMLAEAIHSVADSGNQGLLFLGGRRATRAATTLHPFGYGRERYFWSFIVALVLFTLGGVFALYEGIGKVLDPHELTDPVIAFAVLGLAIALEAFSFRTAIGEAQKVRRGRNWWSFIRTEKGPELPVVLLEDLGALVGLVFALLGVTLTVITGEEVFDAIGSITIGALLVVIAAVLAVEMKSLLIGESASPEDEDAILEVLDAAPAVRHVIHMKTQHLGPDELLVAVKADIGCGSLQELSTIINGLEDGIRAAVPRARMIYIEPDEYRSDAEAEAESTP
jgi:cation diffusion facilitator family transporter